MRRSRFGYVPALLAIALVASCSLTTELDDITGGTIGAGGSSSSGGGPLGGGGQGGSVGCETNEQCGALTDPCNTGRCDEQTHACVAEPRTGQECNDDDLCTHTDRCTSVGTCIGTAYECTSPLECVESACDGEGACEESLLAGHCRIAGPPDACFVDGDPNPLAPCEKCDVATSTTAWTNMEPGDSCVPGGLVCHFGQCDAQGLCSDVGFQPEGAPCGEAPQACERPDTCNSLGVCVDRGVQPSTYVCRPAAGPCDAEERCPGNGPLCPPDSLAAAGADCGVCRRCDDGGICLSNSIDHADCPLCLECSSGTCVNQSVGEDLVDECAPLTCASYLWGAIGAECFAYAGATNDNGTCGGDGACADGTESCTGQGASVAICPNVACVACAPGTTSPSLPSVACYNDSLQHGCAAGYVCVAGDCVLDTGTCPFLYTWDGEDFLFETDIYGSGELGIPTSTGTWRPNPADYYVLQNTPGVSGDALELRLVEERLETNYLDRVALFAADLPVGYDLGAELWGANTPVVYDVQSVLHTLGPAVEPPLSATHVNTGEDLLAEIAAPDRVFAVLNNDRNLDFEYQTLELDLGDVATAPQIKLWIDAQTAFPNNPAGWARKALFGARTKIEVLDGNGDWVLVPSSTAYLSPSKEARRPFVLDISGAFLTSDYRIRLTWLYKIHIDAILVDTSADLPVTLEPLALVGADLRFHGHDLRQGGELVEFVYGAVNQELWPAFPGMYTRHGDVLPLLEAVDDMFAIYWSGDEIALRFAPPSSPPPGTHRRFLLHAFGYYKDQKSASAHEVEPLPFEAMSNYPYDPAVEHYPDDPAHQAYRQTYNTRALP